MLVVTKTDVTQEQLDSILGFLTNANLQYSRIKGIEHEFICVVGDTSAVNRDQLAL